MASDIMEGVVFCSHVFSVGLDPAESCDGPSRWWLGHLGTLLG